MCLYYIVLYYNILVQKLFNVYSYEKIINKPSMLNIPSFIKDTINCTKHKTQTALTYCSDCQVYCCLTDNCGHPHLYHSLENIESFLNSTIIPALTNLTEINRKRLSSNGVSVQTLISSLTTSILNQKKQTESHYQSILISLQQSHQRQMKQLDDFNTKQLSKLNQLQKKIDIFFNNVDITDINNHISLEMSNSNSLEIFIQSTASMMSKYNKTLKNAKENLTNADFSQDIKEITSSAEKDFELLKKTEEACYESFMSLIRTQQQTIDGFHLMKEKNSMPKILNFTFHIKPQCDFDLDIYVRDLHTQFNSFRKTPEKLFQLLKPVYEQNPSNQNSKLGILMNYLKNLALNYSLPLPEFEWDNDLSNCSEDYFKSMSNKIEDDPQQFRKKIKDILSGYYSNEDYINSLRSIAYIGLSGISQVMLGLLLNEHNWDDEKHCLFNNKYNLIGICASPSIQGKIQLIINLGYFKAKE